MALAVAQWDAWISGEFRAGTSAITSSEKTVIDMVTCPKFLVRQLDTLKIQVFIFLTQRHLSEYSL